MDKLHLCAATLALTLGIGSPVWGEAASYEVQGHTVQLPAAPLGSRIIGARLFVALGQQGVAVFDLEGGAARLVEIRRAPGEAVDVIAVGEMPWVVFSEVRAAPLSGGAYAPEYTSPSTAPLAEMGAAPSVRLGGVVVAAGAGTAIIDLGRKSGLEVGDAVNVLVKVPVTVEGIEQGDEGLYREVVSGLGEVVVLGDSRSQVALRRGGRAVEGARVEVLDAMPSLSLVTPERLSGLYEVGFDVRPFLAVGTFGVGTINELWGSWIGTSPYFVEARLQPLSLGWSKDGNLLGMSGNALMGYDNRFFAIGLGGGLTAANTGVTDIGRSYVFAGEDQTSGGETYSLAFEQVSRGGTIAQLVRLGARDGLHFEVRNTFVVGVVEQFQYECATFEQDEEGNDAYCLQYEEDGTLVDTYREFRWGSTLGRFVVPVADLTDLVFDVGGGATGFFSASGGVQSWVRGNGDRGSLALRVAAGYGVLVGQPDEDYINLSGPMLSFGMRWRI